MNRIIIKYYPCDIPDHVVRSLWVEVRDLRDATIFYSSLGSCFYAVTGSGEYYKTDRVEIDNFKDQT